MSKIEIYKQISEYIDGGMSENDSKEFELKMSNDKTLQKEVEDIKILIKNIKNVQSLKLPEDFDSKLNYAIANSKTSKNNIFKLFDNPIWATASSIAAAVLLVATVTVLLLDSQPQELINNDSDIAFEDEQNIEDADLDLHQAKSEKLEILE